MRLFGRKPKGTATNGSDQTSVFRVTVPEGVAPGQEFSVSAGNRIVRVRCPLNSKPGQSLQITVPTSGQEQPPPDSPNVTPADAGAYMVEVPEGVRGGQQFPVTIAGQQLVVTCPVNARPGYRVRVVPPAVEPKPRATKEEDSQLFEVVVPQGVQPGRPFALLAGGVRILVTCPTNAGPGARIRFKLPLNLTNASEAAQIKLSYDKDGWTRTIRVGDMKFQWIRMDDKGDVENLTVFDADKTAYVRHLDETLSLIPATEAVVESQLWNDSGEVLVTYSEVANAQVQTFEEKAQWFQTKCSQLCVEWAEGHMQLNVRRELLLGDSVDAVMSLSPKDLRKAWRFEFIGEAGIDAGGLAREWFHLVTSEMFDPDMGFWMSSASNQMAMEINPASQMIHEDYLVYYRFLGRVMGKALFDRQLVAGHCVQYIYKHLLGWPIQFKDIMQIDEEYYNNLKQMQGLAQQNEDLSMLCLDFTTQMDVMGVKEQVELLPGGADKDVTNDNFNEYLEACLRFRVLNRVKPQLTELLLGFYDVIPEPLLTIFDFQELELLMCGLPEIDLEDWKRNTDYSGDYEHIGVDYPTCGWFWEVVEEFDQEMKARLLQFVTGTSGVPSRGFGVLQGNDGNIRKFTIHGVSVHECLYPRAHTCFNRIDLPMYETKDELQERLKLAVTMVATGFDIE